MAILRLKTQIFVLAYSVFFFYSFHVDFQNLHEFHVDFFKTLTVEFYMKTVEKKYDTVHPISRTPSHNHQQIEQIIGIV